LYEQRGLGKIPRSEEKPRCSVITRNGEVAAGKAQTSRGSEPELAGREREKTSNTYTSAGMMKMDGFGGDMRARKNGGLLIGRGEKTFALMEGGGCVVGVTSASGRFKGAQSRSVRGDQKNIRAEEGYQISGGPKGKDRNTIGGGGNDGRRKEGESMRDWALCGGTGKVMRGKKNES